MCCGRKKKNMQTQKKDATTADKPSPNAAAKKSPAPLKKMKKLQSMVTSTRTEEIDHDLPSETVQTIHIPGSTLQPVEDSNYFKWDKFNKNVAKSIKNITKALKIKSKLPGEKKVPSRTPSSIRSSRKSLVTKASKAQSESPASTVNSKASKRASQVPSRKPSKVETVRSHVAASQASKVHSVKTRASVKALKANSTGPAMPVSSLDLNAPIGRSQMRLESSKGFSEMFPAKLVSSSALTSDIVVKSDLKLQSEIKPDDGPVKSTMSNKSNAKAASAIDWNLDSKMQFDAVQSEKPTSQKSKDEESEENEG